MATMTTTTSNAKLRRPHQKSRLGCDYCKRRRIKCDEVQPACGACIKRNLTCSFQEAKNLRNSNINESECNSSTPGSLSETRALSDNSRNTPDDVQSAFLADKIINLTITPSQICDGSEEADPGSIKTLGLTISDFELQHHFLTTDCVEFVNNGANAHFWQVQVHQIGFTYYYVLHLLLALSATHMVRQRPEQARECMRSADRHFDIALPMIRNSLGNFNAENATALYISSILVCICCLGRGPQPGEYLAFSDAGPSEWFTLFLGVRSISQTKFEPCNEKGHIGQLTGLESILPPSTTPVVGYEKSMDQVHDFIRSLAEEEDYLQFYVDALVDLRSLYTSYSDAKNFIASKSQRDSPRTVFSWLHRVSTPFSTALQAKRPLALIIFAYFTALLKQFNRQWIFDDWAVHIMGGVWKHLPVDYREHIAWPVEHVGFDASLD